ncbi:probable calcium-binding protein CML30 [Tanacetum coccineum]
MELKSVATAATTGGIMSMELKYFIILYMFVEWVKLLHDCYFLWVRPMLRFISTTENTTCRPTPSAAAQAHDTIQVFHANNGREKSLGLNLEIVLKRLGMFCDHDDKRQIIGSNEISGLFDEDEPSLDEVKEAFSAFDRNKDGFIDAKELQHALSEMGYIQISESDCRLMIGGYDVDQDDKISFREFLKLMEDCF